ncbi:MAG TPA: UrcA family protein [Steroidobacteraceae bacterium]
MHTGKFIRLTAVFSLCAAGPALAWPAADAPRQQVVQFSDLNLETPAGNLALYRRIQSAAKSVCEARNSRQLTEMLRARACMKTAIQEAVFAVNDSGLTQRYLAARGLENSFIAQVSH